MKKPEKRFSIRGKKAEPKWEDVAISSDFVTLTARLIDFATAARASDIHLNPIENNQIWVQFRIDGELYTGGELPETEARGIISLLKIKGEMDIAESRFPQDGATPWRLSGGDEISLRLATIPTVYGEKMVIRLLYLHGKSRTLHELGMNEEQVRWVRQKLQKGRGMMLVCGPTGSGKSTTLYSMLADWPRRGQNIVSIEDPVEMIIPGITQVNINLQSRFDYADALQATLRQDPDVIVVGEIRNDKVAAMAVRAAMTGHMVLGSLHTRDALSAVKRLIEMAVPDWQIRDVLTGVIAQRLVRRLCPDCRVVVSATEPECRTWHLTSGTTLYAAKGCDHCRQTGYLGRIGVFETLDCDASFNAHIVQGMVLQRPEVFDDMRDAFRMRLIQGITDTDEGLIFDEESNE